MKELEIRPIRRSDNASLSQLIPEVLKEFGAVGPGYACADPEVEDMFTAYNKPGAAYWVIELEGKILGGGGIGTLNEPGVNYCELQKMYFLEEIRGKGLGGKLISACLDYAHKQGYEYCYLETLHNMKPAQQLYLKFGFKYHNRRLGVTGHSKCPVFMIKKL